MTSWTVTEHPESHGTPGRLSRGAHRRRAVGVACVGLLLVAGACGNDDSIATEAAADSSVAEADPSVGAMDSASGSDAMSDGLQDRSGGHTHDLAFGAPAAPAAANRTVEVRLSEMSFDPATISITPGEVVLFRLTNEGTIAHEFTLGDEAFHSHHAEDMAAMEEGHAMDHADGNGVIVEPGQTVELAWMFPRHSELQLSYVCHVPGHAEAGMVGEINLQKTP